MKNIYWGLMVLMAGCYGKPQIEGFDEQAWKDAPGCDPIRRNLADILLLHETKILGTSQNEIDALLGHPNERELYERSQTFFYYSLTDCDTLNKQKVLSLRFDALDRAREVMVIER